MKPERYLLCIGTALLLQIPGLAATLTVTNLADTGPGTLRQAIVDAAPGDTIDFTVTGTITVSSELEIDKSLAIRGPGATNLTIQGYGTRQFNVTAGPTLISGLKLSYGMDDYASTPGGGAIYNAANLTLDSCELVNNQSVKQGGAVSSSGGSASLTAIGCTFAKNMVNGFYGSGGGAIYSDNNLRTTNCTLTGNYSLGNGGALQISGVAIITSSTVVRNRIDYGSGGGIYNNGGALALQNSIVAGNRYFFDLYPQEVDGGITSGDYNLIQFPNGQSVPGSHNVLDVDPVITPLRDLGGPTRTCGLGDISPALDVGDLTSSPSTDQRGVARPVGSAPDIGAFEGALPPNHPPVVLNPIPPVSAYYGDYVQFTVPPNTFSDPDSDQTLTYSMQDPSFTFSFDPITGIVSGTVHQVGTLSVTIVATDDGAPALSVSNTFDAVVSKRPITVRADDLRQPQGMVEKPLTVTYYNLVGPASDIDTPPTLTTTATASSPPGEYPIVVSGGSDNAYEFVGWTNGTLTVLGFSVKYQVVHSFGFSNLLGQLPEAPMIEASDGKLYGTASQGVFRIGQDGTDYEMIFNFGAITNQPSRSLAALMEGPDGALYGTTYDGGAYFSGTVFKVNKDGSGFSLLHHFTAGPLDGAAPKGLALGTNGTTLYGIAQSAYPQPPVLFALNTNGSGYTNVHEFDTMTEGDQPATIFQGNDGNIYGTTIEQFLSQGVVFKFSPDDNAFQVVFTPPSGNGPIVTQASDGDFYGVIVYGNVVFRLHPDGTGYEVLHTLNPATDGSYAFDSVIEGPDLALYGITYTDGDNGAGTLFRVTKDKMFSLLRTNAFDGGPRFLTQRLTSGSGGALHGVSYYEGAHARGCLFKINTNGSGFQITWSFVPYGGDGAPLTGAGVVNSVREGNDGTLYCLTLGGGTYELGTLFRMSKDGSAYTPLHEFNGSEGSIPGSLFQSQDGFLYGTTVSDATYFAGTIFGLNTNGSDFSVLHSFDGTDGSIPVTLLQKTNGILIGITSGGGANFGGTLFSINTNGTGFTVFRDFSYSDGTAHPNGLFRDSDDTFYGTSSATMWKLNPDNTFTILASLSGHSPVGTLCKCSDGLFYGVTSGDGAFGHGTLYSIYTNGIGFHVLHDFGSTPYDAIDPQAGVSEGSDGMLYGLTPGGGAYANQFFGGGAMYRMARDGSDYAIIHHFHSADGYSPSSGLTLASDTLLYGMTSAGGSLGFGTVFRAGLAGNHQPEVTATIPDQTNVYGSPLSFTFSASTFLDPDAGQSLSYTASGIPPGISFDGPTRTFSSTPTNAGLYSVTVTATDDGTPPMSTNTSFQFSISNAGLVVSANNKMRFVGQNNPTLTGTLAGVTNGDNISATFETSAGTGSPAGAYPITPVFADPDNRLSNYTVTTNAGTLTVMECPSITVLPASLPNGTQASAYSQTLSATGGITPFAFTVTSGILPPGLTLSSSGSLAGTPLTSGAFSFTVTATDAGGCVGSKTYSLSFTCSGYGNVASLLKDILPGSGSSFADGFVEVNGVVYFKANGNELWKTDGTTAGTALVKDLNLATVGDISFLVNVNGVLFFRDGVNGGELWKSDGTAAGTVLVKDIRPGSASSFAANLVNVNGILFFSANDGVHGVELWKSDGTAAGTVMVADIRSGSGDSSPSQLFNLGGTLFFNANDGTHGFELWKSDGTAAGTVMVSDIASGTSDSFPANFVNVNGKLFFSANNAFGNELWKSDGTGAGTVLVKNIAPDDFSASPSYLVNVGGVLYFAATGDGIVDTELWKSDGTAAGTVRIKDINPGSSGSFAQKLVNVGGTLFFSANDGTHGFELWKSDGTAAGTVMVKDINTAGSSAPATMAAVCNTLYFLANDGTTGAEIWKSDGTASGTVLVNDINPGSGGLSLSGLVVVGDTVYFNATDGTHGAEPWIIAPSQPAIVLQPQSSTNAVGSSAAFSVSVSGSTPLIYQWQLNGTNITGATVSNYIIGVVQVTNAGDYRVVIANNAGSITSDVAVLAIRANVSPFIANPISDTNGTYGAPLSFAFAANTFSDPDAGQTLSYGATGLPSGMAFDGPSRAFSGTPTTAGMNSITVTATDNGSPPLSTNAAFTLSILKASLTVTAASTNRSYGLPNPDLAGSLLGVTNGDNITATFGTAATQGSPPGDYPITPALSDPGSKLVNYIVTTNLGTLTVNGVSLNSSATSGSTTFCWLTNAASFILECADNLTPPITWQQVTSGFTTNDTTICYTVVPTPSVPSRFYRLRLP